jgi:hypothetical protein
LTGWHIDIKSGSEALGEALVRIADSAALREWVGSDIVQAAPTLRELLVRQRAMPVALSPEEFLMVKRTLDSVYAYAVQHAKSDEEKAETKVDAVAAHERREARQAALAAIPRPTYNIPIEQLGLSPRVMQHIIAAGVLSVGQLLERGVRGDEGLLSIDGIGSKALTEIKASLDKVMEQFKVAESPADENQAVTEAQAEEPAVTPVAGQPQPVEAVTPEPVTAEAPVQPEAADTVPATAEPVSETAVAEVEPVVAGEATADAEGEEDLSPEQIFLEAMGQTDEDDEEDVDESASAQPRTGVSVGKKKDKDKGKKGARDRVLVFDEELGRTVVQRSRKPGRAGDLFEDEEE